MSASALASREVDGITLPEQVSRHPALELCNTLAGWGEAEPKEYLPTYDHLALWAREVGLVDRPTYGRLRAEAAADPAAADAVLVRTRRFRADLYATLTRPSPRPLAAVGRELRAAGAATELGRDGRGNLVLRQPAGLELPLHAAAEAVRQLVRDGLAGDVGRCPGDGCGWLFLREGRDRRWCIMAICGNRAKARRFAQRQRAARASA